MLVWRMKWVRFTIIQIRITYLTLQNATSASWLGYS